MGGSSKKQTVGYRYLAGFHMGVCRGPVDELVEIQVGERTAWKGSATSSTRIYIDAPKLFGGDKQEGGIQGYCDVMMGEPTQGLNSRLAAMLTGITPAFRGVFSLFYDGLVSALNPYPKPWAMRVRRAVQGWQDDAPWYAARAVIPMADGQIRAMNPAHILVEANTNDDWGRGLPLAQLDLDSYRAAADALLAEGFGLCLRWNRQDRVSMFMQHVLDHIGAAQFVSRRTGKLTLRLIRDDYALDDLPAFDRWSGLLGIDDDAVSAPDTATNEVIVNWRDPLTRKERQSRERNLGAIRAAEGVNATTTDYPGIPTAELAHRVAARDVLAASSGVRRFKVRLDRRGYQLEPGQAFIVRAPERGIAQIVLRAGEVDYGQLTEGTVTVTAAQDVFGLPATGIYAVEPGLWVPPDRTPYPVTARRVFEMTLRDLYREAFAPDDLTEAPASLGTDPTGGIVQAVGGRPLGVPYSYALQARVAPADFAEVGSGDFCPTAMLRLEVSATSIMLWLSGGVDLDRVTAGAAAMLGDEIVRIEAVFDEAVRVARGCVDTVPTRHAAGERIWFYQDFAAGPYTRYALGTTIQARMLTRTSTDELDPALAPIDQHVVAARDARPYPPGAITVNDDFYPEMVFSLSGSFALSWAHRDRFAQADVLIDCLQGDIGPEPGVTYDVEVYRVSDGELVLAQRDIPGKSAVLNGEGLPLLSAPAQGVERMTFDAIAPNSGELGEGWTVSGGEDWRTVAWRAEAAAFEIPLAGGLDVSRQANMWIQTAAGGQLDLDYRFTSWRATLEIALDEWIVLALGRDDYRRPQEGHLVLQLPPGLVSLRFRYHNPEDGFEEAAPTWVGNLVVTGAGELASGVTLSAGLSGDVAGGGTGWGFNVLPLESQRLAMRGATGPTASKSLTRALHPAVAGQVRFSFGCDLYSGALRLLVGGREAWAIHAEGERVTESGLVIRPVLPNSGEIVWEYSNTAGGQTHQPPAGVWLDDIEVTAAEGQVIDPCRVELFSKRPHVEVVAGEEVTTMIESSQRFRTLIAGAVPAGPAAELLMDLVSLGFGAAFRSSMRSTYPQGSTGAAAVTAFDALLGVIGVNGLYTTDQGAFATAHTSMYNASHVPPALPLLSGITGDQVVFPAGAYAMGGYRMLSIVAFGPSMSLVGGMLLAFEGDTPWPASTLRARFRSVRDEGALNFEQEVTFSERIYTAVPGLSAGATLYVSRSLSDATAFRDALSQHPHYEVRVTV
ncbi:Phage protein [plant metagenome]|uniref:Phage protein n=1 Tax=plant metagenome TaxID=1297885 RepID=A0A484QD58_9ZZZZ